MLKRRCSSRELVDRFGQQADHVGLRANVFDQGPAIGCPREEARRRHCLQSGSTRVQDRIKKDPDNFDFRRGRADADKLAKGFPVPAKAAKR